MRDTKSIQVWPSGHGYEYQGDPHGPADQRRLRWTDRCGGTYGEWMDADADPCEERWATVRANILAERYIDRDVLKCDSMLVSDLLGSNGAGMSESSNGDEWTHENVTDLYPDPSKWDAARCREWLDERGVADTDYAEVPEGVTESPAEYWLDELRGQIQEHAEPAEIYEWWAVTEWLAGQLTAIGQPVLDNAYGYWWGRTCTGQSMEMDGTLQAIARRVA